MTKIKPLSFFSKKIAVSIVLILMFISLFTLAENTSANTTIWFSQQHLTTDLSFNSGGTMGFGAVAGNNGFLVSASFYFDVASAGSGTLTAYLALSQNVNGTYNPITGVSWIQKSNTIAIDSNMANFINDNGWLQFNFGGNVNLTVSNQYDIYVINDGVTIKCRVGSSSASFIYFGGSWGSTSSSAPACIVLADTTSSSISEPQYQMHIIIDDSIGNGQTLTQSFYNNETAGLVKSDTDFYVPYGTQLIVYGVPDSGYMFNRTYIANSTGGSIKFTSGQSVLVTDNLEIQTEFSLIPENQTNQYTIYRVHPSLGGTTYINFNGNSYAVIGEQSNYTDVHVPFNTETQFYFIGFTSPITYGFYEYRYLTMLNNGTNIGSFTLSVSNPLHLTNYLTDDNNETKNIQLYTYSQFLFDNTDGSPTPTPVNGVQLIVIFSNWQNIAVIVIYAVFCALLTWKFAFVGLIAGLDIATVICMLTGLLGGLMYPVLGLVIIANIALIIVGSGLLNKRGNGEQA